MTTTQEPVTRDGSRVSPRVPDAIGLVARLVLGVTLIYAGLIKAGHLLDSARAVLAYQIFPWEIAKPIGYVLPMLEIVLGVLILVGFFTRPVAVIISLLWIAFILGISQAWMRGLQIDCGCFGGGGALTAGEKPGYFWEVARDVGLLLLSAWLVWRPRSLVSIDKALYG